ncbi:MAG: PAS domain S-box protein [Bacteroidales bacterium]|nr:PAS domain S-box protein [Bacteroidales bacterium]
MNTIINPTNIGSTPQYSDLFSVEELQRLQDLFSNATGVASLITEPDGTPITKPTNFCRLCNDLIRKTEKGLANCIKSDTLLGAGNQTGPIISRCLSGGIWDAGVSISVEGTHVANWLIGQVRTEITEDCAIEEYAKELGADPKAFREAFLEVPVMSEEKLKSIANLLFTLVNELSEKVYQNKKLEMLVSEQMITEKQLRESEEKYRLLVENVTDLIVKVDKNNKFIYVSPSYCKTFGKTEQELLGNSFYPMVHPDDVDQTREKMKELLEKPYTCSLEQRAMTKEGWRWFSWVDTAVISDNGEIEFVVGVGRDITQRKIAEQEVQKKNELLHMSNAEKEKFFSIIAHDLRGPFNSFLGLTILLNDELETMTTERQKKIVGSMKNMAGNVNRLLENLLNWSVVKRGMFPFNPKRFVIDEIVGACSESCIEQALKKSIDINIDFPKNFNVYADVDMLQSILRNLVSNAIKFTPQGGKIFISATKSNKGSTIFSVKDTGIGMNKSILDSLFRIDVNINRPGTEGEPSTGLGLILCKEFVEKHGGKIWAESTEGEGSTFSFELPGY